jgi:hypothetical protein
MSITIEIPEALRQSLSTGGQSADQTVREAAAVELYRMGRMTAVQVASFLGIPRVGVDAVLKAHGVDLEQSAANIEREAAALSELRRHADRR